LVGQEKRLKHDFKVLNKISPTGGRENQNQNQNLPTMRRQKTGASVRLPLVGQEKHLKRDFKVLNKDNLATMQADQNQNLPIKKPPNNNVAMLQAEWKHYNPPPIGWLESPESSEMSINIGG